jgi:ABC-type cobalamin/Fe3+-siderophores transport system ATPase subunit
MREDGPAPAVRLEEIVVRYGQRRALGPLSLDVGADDFLGVVGPNGAGKTTFLKVLRGALAADEGQVVMWGTSFQVGRPVDASLARRRIGVLFQHHDFFPDLPFTVEDVVGFGRAAFRPPGRALREADREALSAALDALGIQDFRARLYRELSGGERQKVQLARLIAQEAELLLLDEPGAGLDLDWQERLTHLVETLFREHRKTVIMVTHDVNRLPACCNRALLLKDGRAVAFGEPSEVFLVDVLSGVYGCRMEVVASRGRYHAHSVEAIGRA